MAYKMPILSEGRKGGMRLATFEDCLFLVVEPLLTEDLSLMQTFHKSGVKLWRQERTAQKAGSTLMGSKISSKSSTFWHLG